MEHTFGFDTIFASSMSTRYQINSLQSPLCKYVFRLFYCLHSVNFNLEQRSRTLSAPSTGTLLATTRYQHTLTDHFWIDFSDVFATFLLPFNKRTNQLRQLWQQRTTSTVWQLRYGNIYCELSLWLTRVTHHDGLTVTFWVSETERKEVFTAHRNRLESRKVRKDKRLGV